MKILVLGGAKSGKSTLALKKAEQMAGVEEWLFVATAEAGDEEMARRIARHRAERDPRWRTIEEPVEVAEILDRSRAGQVVLVDCLTLWLANVISDPDAAERKIDRLVGSVAASAAQVVLVANEVGLGIVPDNAPTRLYRDLAGSLNQKMAQAVDEVYFVAAGLPLKLK